MKIFGLILMCSDCFGAEHGWHGHWYFPAFFFVFLLMCFMFRGWRRRYYSCGWPGWNRYGDYDKREAKNILKKRYAKGEISKEEFEKMKRDIS